MSRDRETMELTHVIFIALGALIGMYALWYMTGHYIVNASILIASALIHFVNVLYDLMPKLDAVQMVFFFFVDEMFIRDKASVLGQLQTYQKARPSLSDAKDMFYIIGYFLRYPIVLLAVWGSYLCYKRSRPSQLKRSFDIFSLAKYSQKYFPQIRPAIMSSLLDVKMDEGLHRQEASPIRYAILNNAITFISDDGVEYKVSFGRKLKFNEKKQTLNVIDSYDEDEGLPVLHGRLKIDIVKIRKVFVTQITKHGKWQGADALTPQLRALYATFLLFIKGGEENKERALDLLDKFSSTYKSNKKLKKEMMFDDTGVDEVIRDFEDQVAAHKIIKKHTYAITVLMALYHRGTHRKSKLPPSRFAWLKEVDRTTWYALHQNLSPGAWSEAAGPRGIIQTETVLKQKANYPFTDNAIKGYLLSINGEGWLIEQPDKIVEITD